MAKPNYKHAKKQKEAARKARQDAKHQRKNVPDAPDVLEGTNAQESPTVAVPANTDACA